MLLWTKKEKAVFCQNEGSNLMILSLNDCDDNIEDAQQQMEAINSHQLLLSCFVRFVKVRFQKLERGILYDGPPP